MSQAKNCVNRFSSFNKSSESGSEKLFKKILKHFSTAKSEALKYFGNDEVYIEKFSENQTCPNFIRYICMKRLFSPKTPKLY